MQYINQYISEIFTYDDVTNQFGSPPDLSERQFINVQFIDADLRNAKIDGAHFHDVEFNRCNLTGVDFEKAKVTGNTTLPQTTGF